MAMVGTSLGLGQTGLRRVWADPLRPRQQIFGHLEGVWWIMLAGEDTRGGTVAGVGCAHPRRVDRRGGGGVGQRKEAQVDLEVLCVDSPLGLGHALIAVQKRVERGGEHWQWHGGHGGGGRPPLTRAEAERARGEVGVGGGCGLGHGLGLV